MPVDMSTPDFVILIEINERVKKALKTIKNGNSLDDVTIEILKIDKESLGGAIHKDSDTMRSNIRRKIDYIIKSVEKN